MAGAGRNLIPIQKGEVVKMTSKLPDKNENKRKKWPSTSKFTTIKKNIVRDGLSDDVANCISHGQEKKLCCSCGPRIDCAKNPKCECRRASLALKKFFKGNSLTWQGREDTRTCKKNFYNTVAFVCGPECGCKKTCSMRKLDECDRDHQEKFEIIKFDETKGSCCFGKKLIKKGTIVGTFNGELGGEKSVRKMKHAKDYALLLIHQKENELTKFYKKTTLVNGQYRQLLLKTCKNPLYVNPLNYGNFARFFSHSCKPNMSFWRVFQGGLSPADMRIFFVANEKINAGDELTFDYGGDFTFKVCLCQPCEDEREEAQKEIPRKRRRDEESKAIQGNERQSKLPKVQESLSVDEHFEKSHESWSDWFKKHFAWV